MSDQVFKTVLPKLRSYRSEILLSLSEAESQHDLVRLKIEVDEAIACLELCQKYGVGWNSNILVIPTPSTTTPSSEYRLIEDNETDDREHWIEVTVNGESIRPMPGALIIETRPRRATSAIQD